MTYLPVILIVACAILALEVKHADTHIEGVHNMLRRSKSSLTRDQSLMERDARRVELATTLNIDITAQEDLTERQQSLARSWRRWAIRARIY